jgi:PadR family transcriptional regulator PadR
LGKVIFNRYKPALQLEECWLLREMHPQVHLGWLSSEWGVSENNRKAKFYKLTAKGRRELSAATGRWHRMTRAIGLILGDSIESTGK